MKMKRAIIIALFIGLMPIGAAEAEIINYAFQGVIGENTALGISVGDAFTGTLIYDNAAAVSGSGANYSWFSSANAGLAVTVGGQTYDAVSPLSYGTANDVPHILFLFPDATYDAIAFYQFDFNPVGPFAYDRHIRLIFVDAGLTTFTGNASTLPTSLSFDPFDYIQFQMSAYSEPDYSGVNIRTSGLVQSFKEVSVPEPASMLLLGLGLIGLAGARSRVRQ